LSPQQRQQLSALLFDTSSAFEENEVDRRARHLRASLANEAQQRTRVLNRKLVAARKAVQRLYDYAGNLEGKEATLNEARRMLGHPYACAASHALAALEVQGIPVEEYESLKSQYSTDDAPETFGMVCLYWFFRYGCGLTGDESELRVAWLRNAFWTEYGISKVRYRAKYKPGVSKGCDSVHVAVTRFKQNQGYKSSANPA
jgi:hypothetical protein